jgi:hypothetical protein
LIVVGLGFVVICIIFKICFDISVRELRKHLPEAEYKI